MKMYAIFLLPAQKMSFHPCESEDLSTQGILGSCLSVSPRMTEKRDSRFLPIGKPKNDRLAVISLK